MTTANNADDIMSCYSNITDSVRDGYSDILNSFTGKTDRKVNWCKPDLVLLTLTAKKCKYYLTIFFSIFVCYGSAFLMNSRRYKVVYVSGSCHL